jgi:hypothetical protein
MTRKRNHTLAKIADNPYAYARAVFRNEDRINALFDREAGAISTVTRAVLEHAARFSVHQGQSRESRNEGADPYPGIPRSGTPQCWTLSLS